MQHFHHAVTYRELTISWNAAGLTHTHTHTHRHTHADIRREARTHRQTNARTHTSKAGLWVTQCEWKTESGSERAAAGAMGWVGPYGEQRGAGGGLGDGGGWGGWGGLRGDPEPGAACLIGAHLHSSGAGDTWRAFPALSAKWLPLHIFHKSVFLALFIRLFLSSYSRFLSRFWPR